MSDVAMSGSDKACDSNTPRHILKFLHGWHNRLCKFSLSIPHSTHDQLRPSKLALALQKCQSAPHLRKRAYQLLLSECMSRTLEQYLHTRVAVRLGSYFGVDRVPFDTLEHTVKVLGACPAFFPLVSSKLGGTHGQRPTDWATKNRRPRPSAAFVERTRRQFSIF